jgi:acyl carrier protein
MDDPIISLNDEIKNFLTNVLVEENKIDVTKLSLDSYLTDLDIDSFSFLEIIFSIEHQYNIYFPENFDSIKTLQDVINVTHDLVLEKNKAS